jgi:hypothetical protein
MAETDIPKENSGQRLIKQEASDNSSKADEQEHVELAEFPRGFWLQVDYLLHHPKETVESIRRAPTLGKTAGILFLISIFMSAIYGMVMGATNLLQASQMAPGFKFLMIATTGAKVPILFLLTMVIVLPPIYVSNAYIGSRVSFLQMFTLMISTIAVISTSLASGATIALFFSLTSKSYHFIKLLHFLIFACSGIAGLTFLSKSLMQITAREMQSTMKMLFVGWLIIYAFVGLELSWVLRPYIGNPDESFTLFRQRKGNIYESVYHSLEKATTGEK